MPLFLVERTFAERLELTGDAITALQDVADEVGIRWIEAFLSADRLQSYCLFEAPSAEAILAVSERTGMPAGTVIEVTGMFGAVTASAD
jgi:hypothetical protein